MGEEEEEDMETRQTRMSYKHTKLVVPIFNGP